MSGQNWSINIVPEGSTASFVPDVYSESPTSALQAQNNDVISWNNQTDQTHQPWRTDASFDIGSGPNVALCDPVAPGKSSSPAYCPDEATTPATIYYACANHPQEHGTIDVVE